MFFVTLKRRNQMIEFQVGDCVVNPGSLKMGTIVEMAESKVRLEYEGGISEWVETDKVKQLLIDEATSNDKKFLTE
jgi:hypothetical protein|tara:strand:- start:2045 stop:2272 length:228 start_codon:yes stop_codon:yes gene_type:complete